MCFGKTTPPALSDPCFLPGFTCLIINVCVVRSAYTCSPPAWCCCCHPPRAENTQGRTAPAWHPWVLVVVLSRAWLCCSHHVLSGGGVAPQGPGWGWDLSRRPAAGRAEPPPLVLPATVTAVLNELRWAGQGCEGGCVCGDRWSNPILTAGAGITR